MRSKMKKVVINRCFGGFGLSHKAVMRYAELKGIKLYAWLDKPYEGKSLDDKSAIIHYTTIPKSEYLRMDSVKSSDYYFNPHHDIPRDDPILIQVVKELGEEANNSCSSLKVVEIPDDVDWDIYEYDGVEWIAEKHRIWD